MNTELGTVLNIVDYGSIVQVFIAVEDAPARPYAADANTWYRGGAADAIHIGDTVEYSINDWGGLEGISLAPVTPTRSRQKEPTVTTPNTTEKETAQLSSCPVLVRDQNPDDDGDFEDYECGADFSALVEVDEAGQYDIVDIPRRPECGHGDQAIIDALTTALRFRTRPLQPQSYVVAIDPSKRLKEKKYFDVTTRVTLEYRYSVRCDNEREARKYAATAFAQTEAPYIGDHRQHLEHNVWRERVRRPGNAGDPLRLHVTDIGSSDFEQDDQGDLFACECEHRDHFQGSHPHGYGELTTIEEGQPEAVTAGGQTLVLCQRCRGDHAYTP